MSKYLVCYSATTADGRSTQFGRCEVTRQSLIDGIDEVKDIEETINQKYFAGMARSVLVTNIQRFPI